MFKTEKSSRHSSSWWEAKDRAVVHAPFAGLEKGLVSASHSACLLGSP